MGTRGDFYIGRGKDAEWLGSTAWDSYPGGLDEESDVSRTMLRATTEEQFREGVAKMAKVRDDFTPASNGWPWPWDDSATTDYAFAFEDGKVFASGFGRPWFEVDPESDHYGEPVDPDDEHEPATQGPKPVFPNMRERKNVRLDGGSGLIVLRG